MAQRFDCILSNAQLEPTSPDAPAGSSPRRIAVELATAYGLILSVLWTPRPWQRLLWGVAAAGVAAIVIFSNQRLARWGLQWTGLLRFLWVAVAAMLVSACALAMAAHFHTLHMPHHHQGLWSSWWGYILWAASQQFLLQDFFLARIERIVRGERAAALAAAGLFAAAHLPNPLLTALTLLWGFLACLHFMRYRSLYPLAAARAILGITLAIIVPGPIIHNMHVGLGYLTYTPPRSPQP
jgi:hypothetical protein